MITLVLLHPTQNTVLRSWQFDNKPAIRIGRAKTNDVTIVSSVVSRLHLELWKTPSNWEAIGYGANGTYVNGERINQAPVADGMVIRLGSSGPKIQIQLSDTKEGNSIGSEISRDRDILRTTPPDVAHHIKTKVDIGS
ncbi:FHA domain-containing protein [Oscillatoriales cyanobacterium LEGE 11467]|uniref:FHA domain-containing protein n=1 Tax=Zarconia navalis LEGE 11467 TaxID=1828826 RepID=A0A928W1L8_9CYAN|nr:FHA domain-containing protein [Zarconia navalis]MBE9042316.1 FHA domain-containing protein [Zarconia navalis LEGE 11467]